MLNWFSAKCPVEAEDKEWLEDAFLWLIDEFGAETLRDLTVVLPTDEFFPDQYSSSEEDLRQLVNRVCDYMNVEPERVELRFFTDRTNALQKHLPVFESRDKSALGTYHKQRGKYVISLEKQQANEPTNLIATVAHELAHVRLLGEDRLDPDYEDGEPLTDLATVFFGLGIFTANSVFSFRQWRDAFSEVWQADRRGYMTEQMYGYALALFARARGETKPAWAKYLDGDSAAYFKMACKFLDKTADTKIKKL
ncbi:MAG: hypothetical protein M3209_13615 [Acidobacteriota bacterium]|nr:hypothetical protein [Acidobacteriota bacterium]